MKFRILLICLVLPLYILGQSDSTFDYQNYLNQVYTQHPIAKRIRILQEKAQMELQNARGNFDPTLQSSWTSKQFDGKRYYDILNAHLKIPTWIGLDVAGGYNYNNGYYLNPENNLPSEGQAYLSLGLPLLKGLLTDERRTVLKNAKLLILSSENDVKRYLNDLLYRAGLEYWKWVQLVAQKKVIQQSLIVAEQQFLNVKKAFQAGDDPAIDTLKAYIRMEDRAIKLLQLEYKISNQRNLVNLYLWDKEGQPLIIEDGIKPQALNTLVTDKLNESAHQNTLEQLNTHPQVLYYDYKLKSLNLERKLKQNKLLPSLNVKYNFLSSDKFNFFNSVDAPIENYKLGFNFKMPIFIRKERAALKLNLLKSKEVNLDRNFKIKELETKIQNYFVKTNQLSDIVEESSKIVNSYQLLFEAEKIKFQIGENTLILLNLRENQLLEAQLKLIEFKYEYLIGKTAYEWLKIDMLNF